MGQGNGSEPRLLPSARRGLHGLEVAREPGEDREGRSPSWGRGGIRSSLARPPFLQRRPCTRGTGAAHQRSERDRSSSRTPASRPRTCWSRRRSAARPSAVRSRRITQPGRAIDRAFARPSSIWRRSDLCQCLGGGLDGGDDLAATCEGIEGGERKGTPLECRILLFPRLSFHRPVGMLAAPMNCTVLAVSLGTGWYVDRL